MVILAIETSCDETAAALVEDGTTVLGEAVASQIAVHGPYGGVVPEIASRMHVEAILPVVAQALGGRPWSAVDAIAVTRGPGLLGALLVGLSAAKALAYALEKPLIAVNHLEAHMHAAFLSGEAPAGPFVCLVVSGGHTALYRVAGAGAPALLGTTRDDAAGEAFDKGAKILGLGYPGGVVMDRLAEEGDPALIRFPRAWLARDSLDFSFSGLKTALATFARKNGPVAGGMLGSHRLVDVIAGYREAVVDVLLGKTREALRREGLHDVAAVGGVSANSRLRARLREAAGEDGFRLYLPPLRYCTDNAVMVGAAGHAVWRREGFSPEPLDVEAVSRWM